MSRWNRYVETGKASVVFRVLLVLWDIICINLCSFLALMMRYDLRLDRVKIAGITDDYPQGYLHTLFDMAIINTLVTLVVFALFKLYHSLWRFAGINEFLNVMFATGIAGVLHFLTVFGTYHRLPRSYFVFYTILLFLFTLAIRFSYRVIRLMYRSRTHGAGMRNTLIIGAGEACNLIISELVNSDRLDANICGIIDDDKTKKGTYIHGVKVLGGREMIVEVSKENDINEIIVAMPSAAKREIGEILEICQETGAELIVLRRPEENGLSYEEVLNWCMTMLKH